MPPEETVSKSPLDKPLYLLTDDDISQLTREDCRRYLKDKGMRRPSWNKSQAIQQVISLKALFETTPDSDAGPRKKLHIPRPDTSLQRVQKGTDINVEFSESAEETVPYLRKHPNKPHLPGDKAADSVAVVNNLAPSRNLLHGKAKSILRNIEMETEKVASSSIFERGDETINTFKFPPLAYANQEVKSTSKIAEWLINNLNSVLPEKVQPDLEKVAVSGHSKGGNRAFALALDSSTPLKFSALLGIDPVAGSSPSSQVPPYLLKYIPRNFDQSMPVAVIGAGLSSQSPNPWIFPAAAPNGVNHSEFFNESKPPCYYFLAKDYGHADILEGEGIIVAAILKRIMKSGKGPKKDMIRAVGGIVVAFLKAYLEGQFDDLNAIVKLPGLAPITLDPVIPVKD